jgi:hypothetical protein
MSHPNDERSYEHHGCIDVTVRITNSWNFLARTDPPRSGIGTGFSLLPVPVGVQIVGYDAGTWGGPGTDGSAGDERREPALLVADDDGDGPGGGRVVREMLTPGRDLRFALGERRCAGTLDAEFGHRACDRRRAPYCERHESTWVCARCTGTCLKDEMDCYEDHAVYLAAFAPGTFKVGVTRLWRLKTRLREQGADRGAHLRTVENGRRAREIETGIAETVGDSVAVSTKVAGLGRPVDDTAWRDLLSSFDPIDTRAIDYGLDLSHPPVPETLASGTIRGVKGRVLVLDAADTTYAVDMRDLVGYVVREGDRTRDLQSSLGAFG